MAVQKPYNGGEWTEARFNSFIKSALRKARWPVKYKCIKEAFVKNGINPKTGRKCKLHKCADCGKLFPQKDVVADHIEPVVPVTGFTNWDDIIRRMYCEIEGFQALCKECHKIKTAQEREERKKHK